MTPVYVKNKSQADRLERNLQRQGRRKTRSVKRIKRLTQAQNGWLKSYEGATGFEPMHLDELEAGTMTFNAAARSNIDWYQMHMHDAFRDISDNVPFDREGVDRENKTT